MLIDLNHGVKREDIVSLIASVDDSISWQLRVTESGIAYLSDVVGNKDIDGLKFRLETWDAGNGYVGEDASKDESWVDYVYQAVKNNWPTPMSSYIDHI